MAPEFRSSSAKLGDVARKLRYGGVHWGNCQGFGGVPGSEMGCATSN